MKCSLTPSPTENLRCGGTLTALLGIPSSIDDEIRAGRTVVCNVSRTVVGFARRRYASVVVVFVTAPQHVLAERLACRGRSRAETDTSRIGSPVPPRSDRTVEPDVVIRNIGRPQAGIRRLLGVLHDTGIVLIS